MRRCSSNLQATACNLMIGLAVLSSMPVLADEPQLQEVIVTAQKRTQNVKDVPISISEISGKDLNATHTTDYDDLTRQVPSVSFATGGTEGLTNIEIRGVSSSVGAAVAGIYLDDTSLTMQGAFIGQPQPIPFDLARVEVLRGPQGTLYGASSMGGAIRFITNQPKLGVFEAEVDSDLSGTDYGGANYNESVVANIPIASNLALRAGVDYGRDSGWIDHFNYFTGAQDASGINGVERGVVKIDLLYQASDTLSITPSLWLQKVASADSSVFYLNLGLYNTNKEVPEPSDDRLAIPSLKITEHLPAADITSITSYFWRDNSRTLDGTYFNDQAFALYFLDPNPVFAGHQSQNDTIIATVPSPSYTGTVSNQLTEEVRATSSVPGAGELPLQWTAGLYFSTQRINGENLEYSPGLNAAFLSIYGYPLSSPIVQNALGTTATTFDNDLIYNNPDRTTEKDYAVYGQLQYDLLPRLHVAAGARYEYSKQTSYMVEQGFYGIGYPPVISGDVGSSSTTPKVSVVYDLSRTSTAYATVAKGYRLGGVTGGLPASCNSGLQSIGISSAPTSYAPDSLWNYELGTKLLLDDRTISIDVSAYWIDWNNVQQSIYLPTCGFAFIGNFGKARSYGVELQLDYKPKFIPDLTLSLNAGDGKSYIIQASVPTAAAVGQSTLNAPKYTATVSAVFRHPITATLVGFARTDYDYTGMSYGSFQNTDSDFIQPAYAVLNGSIGLDVDSFEISLYGKNLLNNQTIIQRPDIASIVEGYTVRPLTVGINVRKDFE